MLEYTINDLTEFAEEDLKECFFCMHSSRKEKVLRYKDEIQKKLTLAGELSARRLLSQVSGTEIYSFDICPDQNGKLKLNSQDNLFFNISHSETKIAVVVSDEDVGIDIEVYRPISIKVAKKICSDKELLYIFGHIPEDSEYNQDNALYTRRFLEVWTAKEAYLKCIGTGITELGKMKSLSSDFDKIKIVTDEYVAHIVKSSDI